MKSAMKKSSRPASQTKRRVVFAEMSELMYFQKNCDSERKAAWYSKADCSHFKSKTLSYSRRLVEAWPAVARAYVEKSVDVNGDPEFGSKFHGIEHVCGIEHSLSPAVVAMILTSRNALIDQVLLEQERQKSTGNYSAERIAQISANASLFSRAWRHRIAIMNSCNHGI